MAPARRAPAPGGAGFFGVWSGGRLEGDLVAQGFEPGDQAAGFSLGVQTAGEEICAQLVVWGAAGQDVPVALCPPRGFGGLFRVLG
jgi:hypothetical protein